MALCSVVPYAGVAGACHRCGRKLLGRQRRWCSQRCFNVYRREHKWSLARAAARRRDKYRCQKCGAGREASLEVNHVIPLNGRGYAWGCCHHLENLETLCHACHVVVTRAQRAQRASIRVAS